MTDNKSPTMISLNQLLANFDLSKAKYYRCGTEAIAWKVAPNSDSTQSDKEAKR